MRVHLLIFGCLAIGVLSASAQPPPKAESPADKVRTIPLESCYATFGGSGCKFLLASDREPHGHALLELIRRHESGASNVVLVRAKDIANAVSGARRTFAGGGVGDTPGLPASLEWAPELWMVAYIGKGPRGWWTVRSAEVSSRTVRVTYALTKRIHATADVLQHFLWLPLDRIEPGTYSLELFDADRREVMLVRRVVVTQP